MMFLLSVILYMGVAAAGHAPQELDTKESPEGMCHVGLLQVEHKVWSGEVAQHELQRRLKEQWKGRSFKMPEAGAYDVNALPHLSIARTNEEPLQLMQTSEQTESVTHSRLKSATATLMSKRNPCAAMSLLMTAMTTASGGSDMLLPLWIFLGLAVATTLIAAFLLPVLSAREAQKPEGSTLTTSSPISGVGAPPGTPMSPGPTYSPTGTGGLPSGVFPTPKAGSPPGSSSSLFGSMRASAQAALQTIRQRGPVPPPQTLPYGPPVLCSSLILPTYAAVFQTTVAQLRNMGATTWDITGNRGLKLLHAEIRNDPGGVRHLRICHASSLEEPRAWVVKEPKSYEMKIKNRDGEDYGIIVAQESHPGCAVMALQGGNLRPVVRVEARDPTSFSFVAFDAVTQVEMASSLIGEDKWKLTVKPGVDAILMLCAMLSVILLAPTMQRHRQVSLSREPTGELGPFLVK